MTYRYFSSDAIKTIKKTKFKSALMAGTALVAVGLVPAMPEAATVTYTNGENDATNYTLTSDDDFQTVGGGSIVATQSGTIDLSTFTGTLDAMALTDQLTFSGIISGAGGLVINGSGLVILSANNTYSGGTTLSSGTLQVGDGAQLGSGTLILNGGTLVTTETGFDNDFDVNVSVTADSTIATQIAGQQLPSFGFGNSISLGSNTLTFNLGSSFDQIILSGNVTGTGGLIKTGPGDLFFLGNKSFSGGIELQQGTLEISDTGGFGSGAITVTGAGTIELDFFLSGAPTNQVNLHANLTMEPDSFSGSSETWGGNINTSADSNPHTLTLDSNFADGALTVTGVISGTGDVIITGPGKITLTAANTYTGGTSHSNGTLQLNNVSAAGTGGISLVGSGDEILILNANGTFANAINLSTGNTIQVNNGIVSTVSGIVSSSIGLTKTGDGVLALSGNNPYTGGTTIDGGTLRLLSNNAAGTGTIAVNGSTIELGDGVTNANAIDMNASTTLATIAGGTETATQSGNINTSADTNQHLLTVSARDAADTLTVSGIISGSGVLALNGSGTMILTGSNTYTGSTNLANGVIVVGNDAAFSSSDVDFGGAATLSLQNGITLANDFTYATATISTLSGGTEIATISGSIEADEMLDLLTVNVIDAADVLTFSGNSSSDGVLVKEGLGTLVLSGTNTFPTGTTVNAGNLTLQGGSALSDFSAITVNTGGTLQLDASETLGSLSGTGGAINLGINTLTVNQVDSGTYAGTISGVGGILVKDGTATLTLSGTNTYEGLTTIINGTLAVSNANALGTPGVLMDDSGTLPTLDLNNVTIGNEIFVLGNSIDAQIIVDNGDSSGLSGNIDLGADTNRDIIFNVAADSTFTFSGNASGLGEIWKQGDGTAILSGANTNIDNAGSLRISGGTVQLNSDSAAGGGNILLAAGGGTLALSNSRTIANDVSLQANGTVATISGGTETATLSGAIINSDTISHTINFDVIDAGDSLTASGLISNGSFTLGLTKSGLGSLTLSGSNTYTGDTTINGGTLFNNGSLTSDIFVAADGTYGGTGSVTGNVDVDGAVAPGNSIGTTTVTGTVTFNAGSSLDVEFDASGNSDLLDVTGSVTVDPAATVIATPFGGGFTGQSTYTILDTTGGITGSFGGVTFTDPGFFGFLTQGANTLTLTAGAVGSTFEVNAGTPNQNAIADALDGLDPNTNADFGMVFNDFIALGSAAQAAALDQMSSEGLGTLTSSTLATNNLRTQGIASHLNDARQARGGGVAFNTSSTRYAQAGGGGGASSVDYGGGTVWMQGYGGKATMDIGGGDFDVAGIDIGYDTWLGEDLLVGVTVGIARDRENGFANVANAEAEYINFGGHMALDSDPFYVHGIFAVGIGDFETRRDIAFGTTSRTALANFDGLNANFYGEVGTEMAAGDVALQPYLALNYTYIERDGYTETGAGSLNLVVGKETTHSLQGILGFRASTEWQAGENMVIRPEFHARWVHELADGDVHRSMVNFVGSSASFATINDAAGFEDAFVFGTSFDFSSGGNFHFVIGGDYLISDEYDMWSGSGRLLWNF